MFGSMIWVIFTSICILASRGIINYFSTLGKDAIKCHDVSGEAKEGRVLLALSGISKIPAAAAATITTQAQARHILATAVAVQAP